MFSGVRETEWWAGEGEGKDGKLCYRHEIWIWESQKVRYINDMSGVMLLVKSCTYNCYRVIGYRIRDGDT